MEAAQRSRGMSSLFSQTRLQQIVSSAAELNAEQLAWLGGYFSALSQLPTDRGVAPDRVTAPVQQPAAGKASVLYGSQTGNSRALAEKLYIALRELGVEARLLNMKDYRPAQLKQEQRLYVVVSTHGNGEPPDEALGFFRFINSDRAPLLDQLQYAVLALGDSGYEYFCQAGMDLDERLRALGATPVQPRRDCDLDFHEDAAAWQQALLKTIQHDPVLPVAMDTAVHAPAATADSGSPTRPLQAEVLACQPLTTTASAKQVFHLELSLPSCGPVYSPGDILGVVVGNPDDLVERVIDAAGLCADTPVLIRQEETSLRHALQEKRELTSVTGKQLKAYLSLAGYNDTDINTVELESLVQQGDLLDLLHSFPASLDAQQLVDLLRPLQPRQYSIASCLETCPDEVHLLVKQVDFRFKERRHQGLASTHLARLQPGDSLPVFVKSNPGFRLPDSHDTRIIMIAAGTGVAPFRSFLQQREAQGLRGNTWLLFGEQRFREDFFYQTEWQQLLRDGVLERMDVAFSRDRQEKLYVQDRLLQNAADVYDWLQQGASLYVCGNREGMAQGVHSTLQRILAEQGRMSPEQAAEQLEELITTKRYQRDVY